MVYNGQTRSMSYLSFLKEVVTLAQKNMSDIIEAYLKNILQQSELVEIKRSDVAERFDCVPSQINYVINTRFTQEHGYQVESKRGGGGYIRILKIELADQSDEIDAMLELIDQGISYRNGLTIIQTLIDRSVITQKEGRLMLAAIEKPILQISQELEDIIRANILKSFLYQLKYERKH